MLTNAILWYSMLQILVTVLAELICDLQAGEGLVELRRIEAAEDIANNMAQSRNVVYLPQVLFFILRLIVLKLSTF